MKRYRVQLTRTVTETLVVHVPVFDNEHSDHAERCALQNMTETDWQNATKSHTGVRATATIAETDA